MRNVVGSRHKTHPIHKIQHDNELQTDLDTWKNTFLSVRIFFFKPDLLKTFRHTQKSAPSLTNQNVFMSHSGPNIHCSSVFIWLMPSSLSSAAAIALVWLLIAQVK